MLARALSLTKGKKVFTRTMICRVEKMISALIGVCKGKDLLVEARALNKLLKEPGTFSRHRSEMVKDEAKLQMACMQSYGPLGV